MKKIEKLELSEKTTIYLEKRQKEAPKFNLNKKAKSEIISKLKSSQKHLCCYCECRINYKNQHIEHFFEQKTHQNLIFDYQNNLFLSCEGEPETTQEKENRKQNFTCGHKKSNVSLENVNYDLLINPQKIEKILFLYLDNGKIKANKICNKQEEKQVNYTIERLNLDCPKLERQRREAIFLIEKELIILTIMEQRNYILSLLDESNNEFPAFYSAIKDNFEFVLSH